MWNYSDLINVEEFGDKREYFEQDRWGLAYYCKDCESIVEASRTADRGFKFKCKECGEKNVSLWTLESLKTKYKIKDKKKK